MRKKKKTIGISNNLDLITAELDKLFHFQENYIKQRYTIKEMVLLGKQLESIKKYLNEGNNDWKIEEDKEEDDEIFFFDDDINISNNIEDGVITQETSGINE